MGEVYLAHDPKINRDVAIKVLPEHFPLMLSGYGGLNRKYKPPAN
jgi:hypothetical protein